jgi:hypothetical protein
MILSPHDVLKFGILVGLSAIFIDASIAHGLFWDNDPYWTYWITKTFLIIAVFTFGTAFLGVGIVAGAILTAVHTLILEVYYQWLAPVGLPQEPEWLDFNHLWITGVPAHYLAIFAGYLLALWLWRRNRVGVELDRAPARALVIYALVTAAIIVVIDGVVTQMLVLRDFPGLTFFVQHLLIGFVFIAVWMAYAWSARTGWVVGSLMLALVWTTYSMYLGPRGLPGGDPYYSGYDDLWWKSFPGAFASALIGWWLSGLLANRWRLIDPVRFGAVAVAAVAMLFSFAIPDTSHAQEQPVVRGTNSLSASASASGDGMRIVGPDPTNVNSTEPITGSIEIEVAEMGNRWSHVQNTDAMRVTASFTSGGAEYEVTIDRPMPRHPLGRYTTWSGVVYNHEMHGNTGIGTANLPKVKPQIALWGWATVTRNGEVIARMAPAHVMVSREGPLQGVMLEIDTEDKALLAEPDGYINVMWHAVAGLQMPENAETFRTIVGWIALVGITVLFGWLSLAQGRRRVPAE